MIPAVGKRKRNKGGGVGESIGKRLRMAGVESISADDINLIREPYSKTRHTMDRRLPHFHDGVAIIEVASSNGTHALLFVHALRTENVHRLDARVVVGDLR